MKLNSIRLRYKLGSWMLAIGLTFGSVLFLIFGATVFFIVGGLAFKLALHILGINVDLSEALIKFLQ